MGRSDARMAQMVTGRSDVQRLLKKAYYAQVRQRDYIAMETKLLLAAVSEAKNRGLI